MPNASGGQGKAGVVAEQIHRLDRGSVAGADRAERAG